MMKQCPAIREHTRPEAQQSAPGDAANFASALRKSLVNRAGFRSAFALSAAPVDPGFGRLRPLNYT